MLSEQKRVQDLVEAWGIPFARAYAEFIRALSEGTLATSSQKPQTPSRAHAQPATSSNVEEIAETDDPRAAKRAKEADEAYTAAVRNGTARSTEFDPAVPAKTAGTRLRQIFKERGIKQSEVARQLGVAPSVISRVFKHPERSRLSTISNIADAAGIALGELF